MQCHVCGETISDKAADCPHCGASVRSVSDDEGVADSPSDEGGVDTRDADDVGSGTDASPADESGTGTGQGQPSTDEPAGTAGESGGSPATEPTRPVDPGPSSEETDDSGAPTEEPDDSGSPTEQPDDSGQLTGGPGDPDAGQPPAAGQPPGPGEEGPPEDEPGDSPSSEGPPPQDQPPADHGAGSPDDAEPGAAPAGTGAGETSGQPTGGQGQPTGGQDQPTGGQGQPVGGQGQPVGGQGQPTGGQGGPAGGQTPPPQGGQSTGGPGAAGGPGTAGDQGPPGGQPQQGPPGDYGDDGGFDAEEFVGRLPFFPGAAAGFATAVILFTIAVAYAAMIPASRLSTLELGALVLLDLQFAATGHVTPDLFGIFEIVSPRDAALGFLYLLPPLGLYTASKLAVSLNSDEETTLPEAVVGGLTPLLGYFPVMVVVFLLASREGLVAPSIPGLFVAGIGYPVLFGVIGGLYGGGLSGSERRVGTVYGFGAIFAIAIGCFLATFVAAISAPGNPGILTHVLLGTFSYVAVNVFAFGGGSVIGAAGVLALFVVGLTMFVAAFVRAWRASDNESALRGVAKGTTLAPTYLVVLGFYASLVPWLADDYVQDEIGMEFLAAGYADFLVRMRLSGILEYVVVVLFGTFVFAVVLGAVAGGFATLLRTEIRDE